MARLHARSLTTALLVTAMTAAMAAVMATAPASAGTRVAGTAAQDLSYNLDIEPGTPKVLAFGAEASGRIHRTGHVIRNEGTAYDRGEGYTVVRFTYLYANYRSDVRTYRVDDQRVSTNHMAADQHRYAIIGTYVSLCKIRPGQAAICRSTPTN